MDQARWNLLYEPKALVSFVAAIDLATSALPQPCGLSLPRLDPD